MKNKKSTVYILLLLSVVIWGTIGWKVYSTLKEDAPVIPQISKVSLPKKKDSVILLLNYRDPFLGGYPKVKKAERDELLPVRQTVVKEVVSTPSENILPDFQYKGIIRLGKTTQAIINWNGESLMMKAKEKIGEFTILGITDDKLTVTRKNKKYELTIQ